MNEHDRQSSNNQGLAFIKASSCFAPLFLSRLAIFAIPTVQTDHQASMFSSCPVAWWSREGN
jgi:hypothetical protein